METSLHDPFTFDKDLFISDFKSEISLFVEVVPGLPLQADKKKRDKNKENKNFFFISTSPLMEIITSRINEPTPV